MVEADKQCRPEPAAFPRDEFDRLAALRRYEILDTPAEEAFDDLTQLAAQICGTPIALVSLIDAQRQWFKSKQGLDADETPREMAFCAHAILGNEIFEVPNTLEDARFRDNPLVTSSPDIRFYAGAVLGTEDGFNLGTLCVIDRVPRHLSTEQRAMLASLGRQVMRMMEMRLSARRQAESAASLQSILDNVIDAIITIDELGLVRSYNRAAERIFGYGAEQVVGRNVNILMPEPYARNHDGYLQAYRDTGLRKIIGIGRQVEGRRENGSCFPMDLAVTEVQLSGRRHFIGIVRDLSESVRLEKLKRDFVSTVSHELRTPLTSIRGSLGLIVGGVAGEIPAQARALTEIAVKNCDRLVRLINDILDLEKVESGRMKFDMKAVAMLPLATQAMEANRAYAEKHGVEFRLRPDPADALVLADSDRLMQVLTNLLSNAVKYSPAPGVVTLGISCAAGRVRVEVSDHGAGIPAEFHPHIFEKFSQAETSDTKKTEGTGLGLAITKSMLEHMGGAIGFVSEPHVLTTFWFEFAEWVALDVPLPVGIDPAQPRILICEDDRDVAQLLALMLTQAGYAVDLAYSAEKALELVGEKSYVAMTLDLMLPGKSGIDLIQELRASPRHAQLPIVVVSGCIEEALNQLGGVLPVADWLEKPIDQPRLLAAVEKAAGARGGLLELLHVEDDPDIRHLVATLLASRARVTQAVDLAQARALLESRPFDLLILDLSLPDGSGAQLMPLVQSISPPLPVVVFSAHEMEETLGEQVIATLVKSRTSNERLLQVIGAVTGRGAVCARPRGN